MKRFLIMSAATLAMSFGVAHAVPAGVIDTLSGQQPADLLGNAYNDSIIAASFANPIFASLTKVDLSVAVDNESDGGTYSVYLAKDDGSGAGVGKAGQIVGVSGSSGSYSFDTTKGLLLGTIADSATARSTEVYLSSPPTPPGPVFRASFSNILIPSSLMSANGEFWIVLIPDVASSVMWWLNGDDTGPGTDGQKTFSDLGTDGTINLSLAAGYNPDTLGALSLLVEVPEPTSVAVVGIGLLGLGYARRRAVGK